MTTEEKLFAWFGDNWVTEIIKGTMPSKSTVPEQEQDGSKSVPQHKNSTDI